MRHLDQRHAGTSKVEELGSDLFQHLKGEGARAGTEVVSAHVARLGGLSHPPRPAPTGDSLPAMTATTGENRSVREVRVTRHPNHPHTEADFVVVEEPMEIRLDGVPLAVLMRTPGAEEELVLGFALTEGIVLSPAEIAAVRPDGDGDRYRIVLGPGVRVDPEQFRRNAYTTSSCGVCGKASIDAVRVAARPLPAGPQITPDFVGALPDRLREAQPTFATTGGLHGAAIFDANGELLAAAEDVGRHNATDKAIGSLARRRWPLGEVILMVSGRISFEITQKAAVAGIPIVAGVSAGSSLAVELAGDLGMTLVGFVRGESLVVYADRSRIVS
jgi:FdhD protein